MDIDYKIAYNLLMKSHEMLKSERDKLKQAIEDIDTRLNNIECYYKRNNIESDIGLDISLAQLREIAQKALKEE